MGRCFVIQPFDGANFDARYEDVLAPAIQEAGLDPYRVDRDPSVSIPIQDIETGSEGAMMCLADISLDNPNVWFELGFAIATQKEVVLICSDERQLKFPFDVQHRSIIKYQTGSPRDFAHLRQKISERIKALLQKESTLSQATDFSKLKQIEGLEQPEVVALAAICENIDSTEDRASTWQIRQDMERAGFTNIACTIALKPLCKKGLADWMNCRDQEGDFYVGYSLTEDGWAWVISNKDQFALRKPGKPTVTSSKPAGQARYADLDDDIPF